MRVLIAAVSAAVLLSACAPTRGRPVSAQAVTAPPAAQNYVWARNDGRRMADNPDLYRQGQADQAACTASATNAGTLNLQAFTSCMEARGYSRRST